MNSVADGVDLAGMLAQAGLGDRAAFARVYRSSSAKLLGIALRILLRRELAEEALQESFVRIWRNAHAFDANAGSAMTWMIAIVRNQAIDIRRKAGERMAARAVAIEDVELTAPSSSAEDTADLRKLRECLSALGENVRDMVLLAYHQGYSREELARRFDRPVGTVKSALRRGLLSLRECLDGRA